jgi:hypothetical protein
MKRYLMMSMLAAGALAVPAMAMASSTVVTVQAHDNPFLAGAPDGTACCVSDAAPGQSPAQVSLSLAGGDVLSFAATGVTDGAGSGLSGPDGSSGGFNMDTYSTGIAGADGVKLLALVGVFLDASQPGVAPGRLDFTGNLDFATLAPDLAQIFYIGDGLDAANAVQLFTAPTGATRLFLGVVDGYSWSDNAGSYEVTVNLTPGQGPGGGAGGVPEPAGWALMLGGFGGLGAALRRRSARARTVQGA